MSSILQEAAEGEFFHSSWASVKEVIDFVGYALDHVSAIAI